VINLGNPQLITPGKKSLDVVGAVDWDMPGQACVVALLIAQRKLRAGACTTNELFAYPCCLTWTQDFAGRLVCSACSAQVSAVCGSTQLMTVSSSPVAMEAAGNAL
jgi:hypothetical protein